MVGASSALRALACLASFALPVACGGDDAAPPPNDAGTVACATHERWVEGEGCLAAGVQDNGCPAGTLHLEDGTCRAAGIPPEQCGEGFEPDGNMGCTAILPPEPCPDGLMAVPGEVACREVAPCGAGTWGDIPVEPSTEYVDASYGGMDSDGSQAKPWKSIQQGVDAAASGAIVAIAMGSYEEDVDIGGQPVRLWGRCPGLVEIVGTGGAPAAIFIAKGASGAEVRDLGISGAAGGLLLSGSTNVILDRVWLHDLGSQGIHVENTFGATAFELARSLLEGNSEHGVFVAGSAVSIDATVVRGTRSVTAGLGRGINIRDSLGDRADATVRGSLVEENHDLGVVVIGSDATIEATVVRATQPRPDEQYGYGIAMQFDGDSGERASVTVRASLVDANHAYGVAVVGSDGTIESTMIRDTKPRVSDQLRGRGIGVFDAGAGVRAHGTVLASVVDGSRDVGISVVGSDATIDATIVRNTQPQELDQQHGWGIGINDNAAIGERGEATIRASVVQGNRAFGAAVVGSHASIEATVFRDTQPDSAGTLGDGVAVVAEQQVGVSASLTACVLAGNARAGVASFGALVELAQSSLDCNPFHLAGENPNPAASFYFDDRGNNACGCAGAPIVCQVASPGFEGPEPLAPVE